MNALFQPKLKRAHLLALSPAKNVAPLLIAVHRNHSFELVASVLNCFLGLSGVQANFWYSDYDDSLNFLNAPTNANVHIVWLDISRYTNANLATWLQERMTTLQKHGADKIIVAYCNASMLQLSPLVGVLFVNCDELVATLGDKATDLRLAAYAGTTLSHDACLLLARELGTRYIPAMLFPALKVVVTDLDNTLYSGVLGEDDVASLVPNVLLQQYLASLVAQGFMLAIASKNNEEDVKNLFATRKDFPLTWEDFAAYAINWESKAKNIAHIANELNVGVDDIVFIDDNPGERLHVKHNLPSMHVIDANTPEDMLAILQYYPGLYKTSVFAEDTIRTADSKANAVRTTLQKTLTPEEYLQELGITVTFGINPLHHSARITELLHKTNQFILSYKRPSQVEVNNYITQTNTCVITASMADKLSASGIIAVCLAQKQHDTLLVTELVVSCRALGRGIEAGMIQHMLYLAQQTLNTGPCIAISYTQGARNTPALQWLQSISPTPLICEGFVLLNALPNANLHGVTVVVNP